MPEKIVTASVKQITIEMIITCTRQICYSYGFEVKTVNFQWRFFTVFGLK